ncbi:hypothetical protein [Nocardia sp. NPDC059691]|uniref:hypothetical protein n=1 Tax=Nocardia sp. NPDC059691 TaxID=3346908 RepID=UPI00367DAB10
MDTAILALIASGRTPAVALSEPVDEVSRSFGFGIINGVNLARTITDLVRGLNAEDRSRLESATRIQQGAELQAARLSSITAEDIRNEERHQIGMQQRRRAIEIADEDVARRNHDSVQRNAREERQTAANVGSTHLRNQLTVLNGRLRVAEFRLRRSDSVAENARRERATKAQIDASKARENTADTEARIKREDQGRRIQRENNAEVREGQLHAKRLAAYDNRETRAGELHDLEKASIQQQMKLRDRTAGLTQQLTDNQQRSGKAMADAGRFAAAVSTAEPATTAAFRERFREDTGLDPSEFDTALGNLGDLGADPVEALARLLEKAQGADADPATIYAATYVTNLLIAQTEPDTGTGTGDQIGEAVAAAHAAAEPAADADLETAPDHRAGAPENVASSEVAP